MRRLPSRRNRRIDIELENDPWLFLRVATRSRDMLDSWQSDIRSSRGPDNGEQGETNSSKSFADRENEMIAIVCASSIITAKLAC